MEATASAQTTHRTTHFINGQWSEPGGHTFPDYNPFNGEVVADIAAGGRAEATEAVAAANAAFPAWAEMTPGVRQRLFLKAADVIERRTKDIQPIMAAENRKRRCLCHVSNQMVDRPDEAVR